MFHAKFKAPAGSRLAGQIPILKGNEAERKRKSFINDTLSVYHLSMKAILEPLERAALRCAQHVI